VRLCGIDLPCFDRACLPPSYPTQKRSAPLRPHGGRGFHASRLDRQCSCFAIKMVRYRFFGNVRSARSASRTPFSSSCVPHWLRRTLAHGSAVNMSNDLLGYGDPSSTRIRTYRSACRTRACSPALLAIAMRRPCRPLMTFGGATRVARPSESNGCEYRSLTPDRSRRGGAGGSHRFGSSLRAAIIAGIFRACRLTFMKLLRQGLHSQRRLHA